MAERITRDDVVAAALRLLADGGLPALAMRRVANELGVQQSALYWHVENKQTLLAAVADEIVSSRRALTGRRWTTRVRELALALREALLRYPDGAELVSSALAFRLGGDAMAASFRDELRAAGAREADVETAAAVLVHVVLGFTTDEQQHRQAAALGAIEATPDLEPGPATARFERSVDLVIAGFRSRR